MKRSNKTREENAASDGLAGDGAAGDLNHSIDWSATPLGPQAQWPPALQVTANIVMSGSLAMAILWGKEGILICNDACLALADNGPFPVMGKPLKQTWPAAWTFTEPILRKIMREGKTVHLEDQWFRIKRGQKIQDAYFTLSYVPVRLDEGRIGGTLVTLIETTRYKLAEDGLLASREILRAAFASMTDAVFISDTQGRFIDFNDAFITYYRVKSRDDCFKMLSDIEQSLEAFMPDGTPAPLEMWAIPRALRGEKVTNAEYTLKRKDTGETWVGSYGFGPIRDKDARIVGAVVVARDITEHRKLQDDLKRIMREQRTILDTANVGISLIRDRKQVWINKKTEEMFQYPREELVNQTTRKLYPSQEAYERLGTEAYPVLAGGLTYETVQELVRRDGSHIWVKYNGKAIDPPDLSIGTLWILEDITEQKRMQEALQHANEDLESRVSERTQDLLRMNEELMAEIHERRQAEEALNTALTKYQTLFNSFPLGITVSDRQGKIIEANCEAERLLEISVKEQVSRDIDGPEWLIIRPDGTPMPADEFASVRALREQRLIENIEMGLVKSEGQMTWINVTAMPIPLPDYGVVITYSDITARKQAEENLREREEIFFSIVSQAMDATAVIDRATNRFVEFNAVAHEELGYTREEFCKLGIQDIQAAHAAEDIRKNMELAGQQGSVQFETRHRRRDGELRDVRVRIRRLDIRNHDYVAAVWTDITERKKAEAQLLFHKSVLEETGHIAKMGGWFFDAVTGEGFWTDEVARIHDVEPSAYISRDIGLQYYAAGSRAKIEAAVRDAAKFGLPYDLELEIVSAKGRHKWVRTIGHPLMENGRVVNVRGSIQDITEQKHAEAALIENEEMLRTIFDNSPIALEIYDKEAILMRCNRRVGEIFGVDANAQIGTFNLKKDPNYQDKEIWNKLQQGNEVRHVTEFDFSIAPYETTRTGKAYFDIIISPIPDSISPTIGYIVQMIDVTDQVRSLEERERLQLQLLQSQRLESIGRLAGGVAHDFNNMLGVIIGNAEMAIEQVDPNHPIWNDLDAIRKAAQRSTNLTHQLLAFARRQTIAPKVIDLNRIVEDMLKMLRRLIGEDIHLNWLPKAALWPAHIDPTQIDQILANLCVNARDAIDGVGNVTLETGNMVFDDDYCSTHLGAMAGEYVMLAVSDDGCGMEKDVLDNLFEPFYTTKEMGKGTGLGLATVYGIMKQNDGFINVYSERNHGTTFKLYFPKYTGKTEQSKSEEMQNLIQRGKETILVVEDEPAILKLAVRMLEKQGYTLLAAKTPGAAIETAKTYSGEIHLLITDVVMPEMNGRDLAEKLLPYFPGIKKLFMSGYTADVIANHGLLDTGIHFLPKPFSMRGLATKVREVLDAD